MRPVPIICTPKYGKIYYMDMIDDKKKTSGNIKKEAIRAVIRNNRETQQPAKYKLWGLIYKRWRIPSYLADTYFVFPDIMFSSIAFIIPYNNSGVMMPSFAYTKRIIFLNSGSLYAKIEAPKIIDIPPINIVYGAPMICANPPANKLPKGAVPIKAIV